MNKRKIFAVVIASTLVYLPKTASADDVEFNGDVSSTCSINVTRGGTLRTNANVRTLTSGGAGGQHGRAIVQTSSSTFRLYVDQPTDFVTRPTGDNAPDQDYRARIRSRGATSFNWTTNDRALNAGRNVVLVDFRARKAAGQSFANGAYSAVVVIRCE